MMTIKFAIGLFLLAVIATAGVTYTYDAAGRLTKVDYGNGTVISYTYDSAGNLLSRVVQTVTGVTISTIPAGLQFTVDGGNAQTAPQTLNLSAGQHTIAVPTTQGGGAGTQYVFTNWSDSGAASHTINVNGPASLTATFKTQYQLSISASPAAGGTVTPASGSFYDSGASVPVTATANSGYSFTGWSGPVINSGNAATSVTMSAPNTVVANFSQASSHPAFFAGEAALSNNVYFLQFPNSTLFGYYTYLPGGFIFHFDLGYEYVYPVPNDPQHSVYLWDYASGHWWYTSAGLFPYLYDFTVNAWLFYFPDTAHPGHYTANPRQFANTTTQQIFTM